MHTMARRTVGHTHTSSPRCESVVAIRVGGHLVVLQPELLRKRQVSVTTATCHLGNVGGKDRRIAVLRREDPVLAVTVGTGRSILNPVSDGPSMDTLIEDCCDGTVALAASLRYVVSVDSRVPLRGWLNVVSAMAGRTGCCLDPACDGSGMNAGCVCLQGQHQADTEIGGQVRIGMADSACLGDPNRIRR